MDVLLNLNYTTPVCLQGGAVMSPASATTCFPFVGDEIDGGHISAAGLNEKLDSIRFRPLVVLHDLWGPLADLFTRRGLAFEAVPRVALLHIAGRAGCPGPIALSGRLISGFGCILRLVRFRAGRNVGFVQTNIWRTSGSFSILPFPLGEVQWISRV
jgi:hypothetical protein